MTPILKDHQPKAKGQAMMEGKATAEEQAAKSALGGGKSPSGQTPPRPTRRERPNNPRMAPNRRRSSRPSRPSRRPSPERRRPDSRANQWKQRPRNGGEGGSRRDHLGSRTGEGRPARQRGNLRGMDALLHEQVQPGRDHILGCKGHGEPHVHDKRHIKVNRRRLGYAHNGSQCRRCRAWSGGRILQRDTARS